MSLRKKKIAVHSFKEEKYRQRGASFPLEIQILQLPFLFRDLSFKGNTLRLFFFFKDTTYGETDKISLRKRRVLPSLL